MEKKLKSILYVEDDPHLRATVKLVFEVIGQFEVRDCGSGHEALHVAQDFHPDLMVLDMMMPELDGMDTLAMLRLLPHLCDTPVVFITGVGARDIEAYVQAGVIGLIAKPVIPLRLNAQVQRLWQQR